MRYLAGFGSADSKTTRAREAERATATTAEEERVTVMVQLPPDLSRYEGRAAHLQREKRRAAISRSLGKQGGESGHGIRLYLESEKDAIRPFHVGKGKICRARRRVGTW